jgi:hypothetical protein
VRVDRRYHSRWGSLQGSQTPGGSNLSLISGRRRSSIRCNTRLGSGHPPSGIVFVYAMFICVRLRRSSLGSPDRVCRSSVEHLLRFVLRAISSFAWICFSYSWRVLSGLVWFMPFECPTNFCQQLASQNFG